MIQNYIKIAFRNLLKRKGYFFLNLIGITIGMTSCLLIFHYVSYEKSYDEHIPEAGNIYRLRLDNYQRNELSWKSATIYPGIGPAMKHDFPEIQNYCRLIDAEMLLTNEKKDTKFSETKGYFADPSSISILGIQLLSGEVSTALKGPFKILISENIAKKYFGNENAFGKTLKFKSRERQWPLEVSGVFKNYPPNAHLAIEYLVSFDTYSSQVKKWTGTNIETLFDWYDFYTYLQLKPGTDANKLETKLPGFCQKYGMTDLPNKTYDELHLIPVRDIHLKSNYNQEAEVNGNEQTVSFLFMIGIFIICIAWINYVNLSTARSVERAKEVGIKKVIGAFRSDLIKQFLVENVLMNGFSLLLSLFLFTILLSYFDSFTGRDRSTHISLSPNYWYLFGFIFIGGTATSGLYPAFILSGFQPIKVLKGAFKNTSKGVALRQGLIVAQFMVSVILIAGTIIVYQQVSFMRNQKLGMSIDKIVVLRGAEVVGDSIYKNLVKPFRQELLQNHSIKGIAASSYVPGKEIYSTSGVKRLEANKDAYITHYFNDINYDFVPVYEIEIIAGRNFSRDFESDKIKKALINEQSMRVLGFRKPEDAINKKIIVSGEDTLTVLGVTADYHQEGLQKTIEPIIMKLRASSRGFYSLKIDTKNWKSTLAIIQKTWRSYFPEYPMDYFFLDENFIQQYKTDELFGKVFGLFACLAILIACSGLLGLSAYNVLQRSKEIGVRKILGASSQNILLILSKDFIRLIIISLILAFPLGWYIMNSWLQGFAYKIEISWWTFTLAGMIALLIAATTIILNAYKAVIENPIKSLRSE